MAYLHKSENRYYFFCPGCRCTHCFDCGPGGYPNWTFNGNLESPTFTPSLLYPDHPRCHLIITDGKIQYLSDCHHRLAGQLIAMEPY